MKRIALACMMLMFCAPAWAAKTLELIFKNPLTGLYDSVVEVTVDPDGQMRFKDSSGANVLLDDLVSAIPGSLPALFIKDFHLDVGNGVSQISLDDLPDGLTFLHFTNERAQDAVGTILTNTPSITWTYDDPLNQIRADVNGSGLGSVSNTLNTLVLRDGVTGGFFAGTINATELRVDGNDPTLELDSEGATGLGVIEFKDDTVLEFRITHDADLGTLLIGDAANNSEIDFTPTSVDIRADSSGTGAVSLTHGDADPFQDTALIIGASHAGLCMVDLSGAVDEKFVSFVSDGGDFSLLTLNDAKDTITNTVIDVDITDGDIGFGGLHTTDFPFTFYDHVGPDVHNTVDLGSDDIRWRDIYVAPGSIHIGPSGGEAGTNEATLSYDDPNDELDLTVPLGGAFVFTDGTNSVTLDPAVGFPSGSPTGAAGGELGGTYPNPTVNDGADGTAIHNNIAGEIAAITQKVALAGADLLLIEDSAAGNAKRRVRVDDLPTQFYQDSADTPTSTTGAAYGDIAGMSRTFISGEEGTWLVSFSASGFGTVTAQQMEYTLSLNGSPVGHSERDMDFTSGAAGDEMREAMHTQAVVTGIAATNTISAQYRTNAGTFNVGPRSLIFTKLN